MHPLIKASSTVIAVLMSSVGFSQSKVGNAEVGIHAGTLIYQGDLSEHVTGNFNSLKPAVGVFIAKPVNEYVKLKLGLTRGKLAAADADYDVYWRQQRSFTFSTPLTELALTMEFNPYGSNQDFKRLTPYVFAGAGAGFLNIKRDWSKINPAAFDDKSTAVSGLAADTLHHPSKVLPIIPMGVGLHYSISPKIGLKAEATYRYTASDYLDGFKFAGNPERKDSYYGISLGLSFLLGSDKYACPVVR